MRWSKIVQEIPVIIKPNLTHIFKLPHKVLVVFVSTEYGVDGTNICFHSYSVDGVYFQYYCAIYMLVHLVLRHVVQISLYQNYKVHFLIFIKDI